MMAYSTIHLSLIHAERIVHRNVYMRHRASPDGPNGFRCCYLTRKNDPNG